MLIPKIWKLGVPNQNGLVLATNPSWHFGSLQIFTPETNRGKLHNKKIREVISGRLGRVFFKKELDTYIFKKPRQVWRIHGGYTPENEDEA